LVRLVTLVRLDTQHCGVQVIADAGHYSWEDNPEPYLAHVLDWIERAEAHL
jgi:pimeloyl-ACP methyl ester carboxylesterase